MINLSDTIFAVSSGRPPAAITVIRISGSAAMSVAQALAGSLPPPRRAGLRALRATDGELLDEALVLCFPGPATATGEDVVELHCHGGRAVVAAVERVLAAHENVRLAEPGEFTRRALANGRIDLLEAEGLADLLTAETEEQRRLALAGAGGVLSRQVRRWMDELAQAAAAVEVQIDYAEEGEIGDERWPAHAISLARQLADEMQAVLDSQPVERIREGVKVVIAGPPNTGKSSLINAMSGRDIAISSPIAGTTRDRLESPVSRGGVAYTLIDTAGVAESDDLLEQRGVELAWQAVATADLLLWTGDDLPPDIHMPNAIQLWTRSDLLERSAWPQDRCPVSAFNANQINGLWMEIEARTRQSGGVDPANGFSYKHRSAIAEAVSQLSQIGSTLINWIMLAEHLRLARNALARLTGEQATESMLDTLFSRFCLGK